ncbi:MAG: SH3 domain-containing protein [Chloroflexi bacterium]|nr:SH3 domain-containing protein [Chloroflexota bacterium]
MWRKALLPLCILILALVAGLQPAAAQGVLWSGGYYNNVYFIEPQLASTTVNTIAFNWGTGSPDPSVPADNFSARFGTDVNLPAGTYRFYALADDGIVVTIDYQTRIIDSFNVALVGQVISADITLTAGTHHIQIDYREYGGTAFLYLQFVNLATNPTGPNFGPGAPVPTQAPSVPTGSINTSTWTAQYYANTNLSGFPSVIQTEAFPSRNWGLGAPFGSIPADNFSVRWSSVQTLAAGNYVINVRADDGVRVTVDSVVYINQFPGPVGQVFTINLALAAGQHTFVVEFLELGGAAYIEYSLTLPGVSPTATVPPTPIITGATVRINAPVNLNVRAAPSTSGAILVRVNRGEVYPAIGRSGDSAWIQINANGTIGWVSAQFITFATGSAAALSVTDGSSGSSSVPLTGFTLTATSEVNIRSGPGTRFGVLGRIPQFGVANIVGRNSDTSWWQISYSGIIGWVSARFVSPQSGIDLNRVPVRG